MIFLNECYLWVNPQKQGIRYCAKYIQKLPGRLLENAKGSKDIISTKSSKVQTVSHCCAYWGHRDKSSLSSHQWFERCVLCKRICFG